MGHNNSGSKYHLGHIQPKSVYTNILLILLALTVITVLVAEYVHIGKWNIVLAMGIASLKAGLVAMFFMHLRYESKILWMYVAFPILLVIIMIGGVYTDNPFRTDPVFPQKDVPLVHVEGATPSTH